MAKYATLADCNDPALRVTALNLLEADVLVDLALATLGITPTEAAGIVLPNAALTLLAATWAKRLAAIEGAIGENSPLLDKANQYENNAKALQKQLNRVALGLTQPAGTGYGTLTLGRA